MAPVKLSDIISTVAHVVKLQLLALILPVFFKLLKPMPVLFVVLGFLLAFWILFSRLDLEQLLYYFVVESPV